MLAERADVTSGDVFELRPDQYDIGTMFFVAESITSRAGEFLRAGRTFVRSLTPNAPFAMAFMRDSEGYTVGDRYFPAWSIEERDVVECLRPVARIGCVEVVESHDLRDGYNGMIVATGWKR
jgi:hypothetical protein